MSAAALRRAENMAKREREEEGERLSEGVAESRMLPLFNLQ